MDKKEKNYYDHMKDLTEKDILRGLVGHGLFHDKLPPVFQSEDFYEWCIEQKKKIESKPKDYIRTTGIKQNGEIRHFGIPDPFAYYQLCSHLSQNWGNLTDYFEEVIDKDSHKISCVHVGKLKGTAAIFKMSETFGYDPYVDQSFGKRYIVKADISKCFSSIYTHAIEWAISGKEYGKKEGSDKNPWVKNLDKYTRHTKYGETNGILIGPAISNILSEIILTKIDHELLKKKYSFIRYIDDYTCFVEDRAEAEDFLVDFRTILAQYELKINDSKTRTLPILTGNITEWLSQIRDIHHFEYGESFAEDLTEEMREILAKRDMIDTIPKLKMFLDKAVLIHQENNKDGAILTYVIKILSRQEVEKDTLKYYLTTVFNWMLLYPYLLPFLEKFVLKPFFKMSEHSSLFEEMLFKLWKNGKKKRDFQACTYVLFLFDEYTDHFKLLDDDDHTFIVESEDCILMTLGNVYSKKYEKNKSNEIYKTKAQDLIGNRMDKFWLFIYETLEQEEFCKCMNISCQFKTMKKDGVSFLGNPKYAILKKFDNLTDSESTF